MVFYMSKLYQGQPIGSYNLGWAAYYKHSFKISQISELILKMGLFEFVYTRRYPLHGYIMVC